MAGAAPLPMRRHLFQDFSLPGQPRDKSRTLVEILREEGIRTGSRVGVVGWKTFSDPSMTDIPSYLADSLRDMTSGRLENATDLLIDPGKGLRVKNELEQLVACSSTPHVRPPTGSASFLLGSGPG